MSIKIKLYLFEDKMEAVFSDQTNYIPKANETQEAFSERLRKIVEDDYLDEVEDFIVIDKEVIASNEDSVLMDAFDAASGLQKKLIESVLGDRGLVKVKTKRAKVENKSMEEMKASEHYKQCEANIGKYVSFSPHKSDEVLKGKIAGVALNKTNTIVYYTVVLPDGKRKCCACKNETVKFIAEPKEAKKSGAKDAKETKSSTSKPNPKNDKNNQSGDGLGDADKDLM